MAISLKLGVVIGHTNGKTKLSFGGDSVSYTDSGSLSRASLKFWDRSGGHPDPHQFGNPDSNPGSHLAEVDAVAEVCSLYVLYSLI